VELIGESSLRSNDAVQHQRKAGACGVEDGTFISDDEENFLETSDWIRLLLDCDMKASGRLKVRARAMSARLILMCHGHGHGGMDSTVTSLGNEFIHG